ncbi:MAG: AraC family transcriptional regulator ligand-binding domain-containing protein [Sphingobium sp.]
MARKIAAAPVVDMLTRYDAVEMQMLYLFPELVEELGGDPHALLTESGIDADAFLAGKVRASYRQTVELMELSAARLACPDFGMRLGSMQSGRISSPLVIAMKHSRTFGEALRFVTSHSHAHSLAATIWLRQSHWDGFVSLGHDILLDGLPHRVQAVEQILLVAHHSALEATGGRVRARCIVFRHQPLSSLRTYHRMFGCEVRFGLQANSILFHEGDMECPILNPDEEVHARIAAFIDTEYPQRRPLVHAQVRALVMRGIASEYCTNNQVAAALALHPRTLHRRLTREGTSFQQIKNDVRQDMMLYYLKQTAMELSQVSERLGFVEQSAMTHYCRKRFGQSPTQLRTRAQKARAADLLVAEAQARMAQ